jgi:hypothetical protein
MTEKSHKSEDYTDKLSPQETDLIYLIRGIHYGRLTVFIKHHQPERTEEAIRSKMLKTSYDIEKTPLKIFPRDE